MLALNSLCSLGQAHSPTSSAFQDWDYRPVLLPWLCLSHLPNLLDMRMGFTWESKHSKSCEFGKHKHHLTRREKRKTQMGKEKNLKEG